MSDLFLVIAIFAGVAGLIWISRKFSEPLEVDEDLKAKAAAKPKKVKPMTTLVLTGRPWRYVVGYLVLLPALFGLGLLTVFYSAYTLMSHDAALERATPAVGKVVSVDEEGYATYEYQAKLQTDLWTDEDTEVGDKRAFSYDPDEPARIFEPGYEDEENSYAWLSIVVGASMVLILPLAAVIDYKNGKRKAAKLATEKK